MEGETAEDPTLFPATVGEKLRGAREAQGLELSEVAARTRIPQRHLEAIEKSNYDGLPSVTYSIGFAKSYARAVGADEVEIARELRTELGRHPDRAAPAMSYEMEDPTRVPPRWLAGAGIAVALLVLVGVALWYGTGLFRGSAPPPETLTIPEGNSDAGNAALGAATPIVGGGEVALIASDTVWIRITDAKGQALFEKEMAPGERYVVPMGADRPRIRTAGPEKLQVTLNGSNVAALGPAGQTVDMEVSAAAIQARGQPAAAASPAPASPTPAPKPASSPAVARSSDASPTRAPAPRATPAPPRPTPEPATGNTSGAP
jgi:transcriptional regulator with XRE-family HTH domain